MSYRSRSRSRSPVSRSRSRSPPPPPVRSRSRSRTPPRRRYSRSRSRSPYQRRRDDHYGGSRSGRDERASYYGGGSRRRYGRSRSRSPYYGSSRRDRHHEEEPRSRRRGGPYRGTDEERSTTTCMYVGNLPYQYREGDMRAIFEPFGPIKSISIPMEHEGRKNRGYCFVDFEVRADAEKAMAKCQDTGLEIEGRRLRLDWDVTPMEQRRITN